MAAALPSPAVNAPRDDVRLGVRNLLSAAEGYHSLDEGIRRDIASSLVRIGSTALSLAEETDTPPRPRPVLAQAQNAGSSFSGVATDRLAGTTQAVLNAVSFPRFVSELITGVFKAMNDSNQQQMTAFVDLIRNVAATTEGFAEANTGDAGAREWLAERFPGSFMIEGDDADDGWGDDPSQMTPEDRTELQAERDASIRLKLRPGGSFPSEAALRTALGVGEGESIPTGDPENLVGLARAVLARNRQQLLSTMVQMGLQRIVIDSGRLNASMKFHIDTRSAANDDRGSQFDMRNTTEVGAKVGVGIWGAEAKMQNTIGYVTTERTQTTEEMNTELDLDSGVELIFRTDYVPLERLAGGGDVERIRVNSLNPEAEAQRIATERAARATARGASDTARRSSLDSALHTPPPPPAMTPVSAPSPPGAGSGGSSGRTASGGSGASTGSGSSTGSTGTGGAGSGGSTGSGGATGSTGTGGTGSAAASGAR